MQKQPWLGKPLTDILFILMPPFISLLIILVFPEQFRDGKQMSTVSWLILVLLIDVGHVYSTLYRTYFDRKIFHKQKALLTAIPMLGFISGVLLYSINPLLFWRILAYVAVFHFVRQQFGFMRIYSRKEPASNLMKRIDTITIYAACMYPLVYWHLNGPRNFNWFIDNDFIYASSTTTLNIATSIYYLIILVYLLKEIFSISRYKFFNLPKFLVISGTIISWYFGIVYFNGDMAFTLLNVVSHGIPYIALIWIYGNKKYTTEKQGEPFLQWLFSKYGIPVFIGLICLFAFIEEGIWDNAIWKDHGAIFKFGNLNFPELSEQILAFLVPLLALPQITHYILDGFIWRIRKDDFKWNNELNTPGFAD